jgi:hypothetical protein
MRKFVSLIIASTAIAGLTSACSVEAPADEQRGVTEEAACANPQGTNAIIAALAVAIGRELGRWQVTTDFKTVNLQPWYPVLALSPAGQAQCTANGSSCSTVKALLSLQDTKYDGLIKFRDGTVLSAYNLQSRLYAGWQEQKVCESRPANNTDPNNCAAEAHKLVLQGTSPGPCDMYYTFKATKLDGKPLSKPAQLINKLLWARKENNPYIAFQSTASTVTIDPLYWGAPVPKQTGGSCYVMGAINPVLGQTVGSCCKHGPTGTERKFVASNNAFYAHCPQ